MHSLQQATDKVITTLFAGNDEVMRRWMESVQQRMVNHPEIYPREPIRISSDAGRVSHDELSTLCQTVIQFGFAHYAWKEAPTQPTHAVSQLLGRMALTQTDKGVIRDSGELSLLQDLSGTPQGKFPAYKASAMNWHTDGYYNAPEETVRCFTLHCLEPAQTGGALRVLDDTFLIYALLKENPKLVALLCDPEAMTLPRNKDDQGHDRPDRHVSVIQRNTDGSLSMRFTMRTKHIKWRCAETRSAALRAIELIDANKPRQQRLLLKKGEGLITRNILHSREAFTDTSSNPGRQILRGRFANLPQPNASPLWQQTTYGTKP